MDLFQWATTSRGVYLSHTCQSTGNSAESCSSHSRRQEHVQKSVVYFRITSFLSNPYMEIRCWRYLHCVGFCGCFWTLASAELCRHQLQYQESVIGRGCDLSGAQGSPLTDSDAERWAACFVCWTPGPESRFELILCSLARDFLSFSFRSCIFWCFFCCFFVFVLNFADVS